MRQSKISLLSLPRPSWWVNSLIALFSLFILEIISSRKSKRYIWRESKEDSFSNTIPRNTLPENLLMANQLESTGLEVSLEQYEEYYEVWGTRTKRLYIAIVLVCAGTGFFSLSLPKPLYFGLILWGMPFVSAYFLAKSWPKEED